VDKKYKSLKDAIAKRTGIAGTPRRADLSAAAFLVEDPTLLDEVLSEKRANWLKPTPDASIPTNTKYFNMLDGQVDEYGKKIFDSAKSTGNPLLLDAPTSQNSFVGQAVDDLPKFDASEAIKMGDSAPKINFSKMDEAAKYMPESLPNTLASSVDDGAKRISKSGLSNFLNKFGTKGKLVLGGLAAGAGILGYNMIDDEPVMEEAAAMPPEQIEAPMPPVVEEPIQQAPVEQAPIQQAPVEQAPIQAAPEPQEPEMDFSSIQNAFQSRLPELEAAQKEANRQRAGADLAQSGINMGRAISGADKNESIDGIVAANRKDADNVLSDAKERITLKISEESRDPNSNVSNMFRKFAKMQGVELPDNFSAEMGKEFFPAIYKKNNDLALKRLSLQASKDKVSDKMNPIEVFQGKEDIKEDKKVKTENREARRTIDNAIPALDKQIANIQAAMEVIKSSTGSGTGPIDQFISPLTPQGQRIQKALNTLSLDVMVQMFAGMSKAIDSDSERRFFQSAQPSLGKYESVNLAILQETLENTKSLKEKTISARDTFDRFGTFTREEDADSTNPVDVAGKKVTKKGYNTKTNQTQLIYSDGSKEIIDGKR